MDVLELPRPVINFLRTMSKEMDRYSLCWDIYGGSESVTLTLTWKINCDQNDDDELIEISKQNHQQQIKNLINSNLITGVTNSSSGLTGSSSQNLNNQTSTSLSSQQSQQSQQQQSHLTKTKQLQHAKLDTLISSSKFSQNEPFYDRNCQPNNPTSNNNNKYRNLSAESQHRHSQYITSSNDDFIGYNNNNFSRDRDESSTHKSRREEKSNTLGDCRKCQHLSQHPQLIQSNFDMKKKDNFNNNYINSNQQQQQAGYDELYCNQNCMHNNNNNYNNNNNQTNIKRTGNPKIVRGKSLESQDNLTNQNTDISKRCNCNCNQNHIHQYHQPQQQQQSNYNVCNPYECNRHQQNYQHNHHHHHQQQHFNLNSNNNNNSSKSSNLNRMNSMPQNCSNVQRFSVYTDNGTKYQYKSILNNSNSFNSDSKQQQQQQQQQFNQFNSKNYQYTQYDKSTIPISICSSKDNSSDASTTSGTETSIALSYSGAECVNSVCLSSTLSPTLSSGSSSKQLTSSDNSNNPWIRRNYETNETVGQVKEENNVLNLAKKSLSKQSFSKDEGLCETSLHSSNIIGKDKDNILNIESSSNSTIEAGNNIEHYANRNSKYEQYFTIASGVGVANSCEQTNFSSSSKITNTVGNSNGSSKCITNLNSSNNNNSTSNNSLTNSNNTNNNFGISSGLYNNINHSKVTFDPKLEYI